MVEYYLTIGVNSFLPFRAVILQRFINETGENVKESNFYLDEHDWILQEALEAWKSDAKWEVKITCKLLKSYYFISNRQNALCCTVLG